ncbi:uncharacterized protein [Prorops nasuta]|uniref:uncharacterized protein isoform X2 n=1 Tax=Prorops nasuta TaxID=863751 RepID=UPI0034CDBDD6
MFEKGFAFGRLLLLLAAFASLSLVALADSRYRSESWALGHRHRHGHGHRHRYSHEESLHGIREQERSRDRRRYFLTSDSTDLDYSSERYSKELDDDTPPLFLPSRRGGYAPKRNHHFPHRDVGHYRKSRYRTGHRSSSVANKFKQVWSTKGHLDRSSLVNHDDLYDYDDENHRQESDNDADDDGADDGDDEDDDEDDYNNDYEQVDKEEKAEGGHNYYGSKRYDDKEYGSSRWRRKNWRQDLWRRKHEGYGDTRKARRFGKEFQRFDNDPEEDVDERDEASHMTYDDIIRRLTFDDSEKTRNSKQGTFANLKYEPKRSNDSNDDSVGPTDWKNGIFFKMERLEDGKSAKKDLDGRNESLEADYREYAKGNDDEKKDGVEGEGEVEEDLAKAGVQEDSADMQADVTNADYIDDGGTLDEKDEEEEVTGKRTTSGDSRRVLDEIDDHRSVDYRDAGSSSSYPPMSAHSVHKWQSLGTREAVQQTRNNMQRYHQNGKSNEIKEALQHAIRVSKEGSCQWPRARVIPVREVYPSPSTTYIPHCAILHRCSDDTGCCRSESLTCVPKQSHRVELYFYTTSIGGSSIVEKLSFYNHTECECRERTTENDSNERNSEQRFSRHYSPTTAIGQPLNIRRPLSTVKACKCPSEFSSRVTADGECQCNCFENEEACIKTRRGKAYFSLRDRMCIQSGECTAPTCEFGEYMKRQGKCPRKKDKFDAITNYRTSLNQRYGGRS